jgi:hypothetical protein
MTKTIMGEAMEILGQGLAFKNEFTKDQLKTVAMMEKDGIVKISRRGQGRPTLYALTQKGKMLYNLTK